MTKLAIAVLTCVGFGLAGAGVASADAKTDFLNFLESRGATVNQYTEGFLLVGAYSACQDISDGVPVDQVQVPYPGASPESVRDLVNGAYEYLCPPS